MPDKLCCEFFKEFAGYEYCLKKTGLRSGDSIMLDLLCYKFFKEFARYEYCLKVTGRIIGNSQKVKPSWDRYAEEVAEVFTSSTNPEFTEAVNYFLKNPPKKQIIKDGILTWAESSLEEKNKAKKEKNKAELVFTLIRRVRNNLFHGGKFNGRWFQPERSKLLMKHALTILKTCAQSHNEVSRAYEEWNDSIN